MATGEGSDAEDLQLLQMIRDGKLHQVFDRVYKRVERICRGACAGRQIYGDDQNEVVQEMWKSLWEALSRYHGGSFDAFVRQIANRRCADWIERKVGSKGTESLYDDEGEIKGDLEQQYLASSGPEQGLCAKHALEDLERTKPRWYKVLAENLLHADGVEELAQRLQRAYGTANTLLSEARSELRRLCLKHCGTANCSRA